MKNVLVSMLMNAFEGYILLSALRIEQLEQENCELKQQIKLVFKLLFEEVKQIKALSEQVIQMAAKIRDIEARLSKNSQNSSKPPSTDGYHKPKPASRRGKSGKSSGGQLGHKGHTLNQVSMPDFIKTHQVSPCCAGCQGSLEGGESSYELRQEFDIPPLKVQVTEHRVEVKECRACGYVNKGDAPIKSATQYGKRVEALAMYLGQYQLLPFERSAQMFKDLFSLNLSQGTLANIYKRCHAQLSGFEETVKAQLRNADVAHFDESGVRIKKVLNWLHVASNEKLTYYHIDPKRGNEAMDRMEILPNFKGRAIHDHWKSYFQYSCLHGLCNAHYLREFKYQAEEYQQSWCTKMTGLLLEMKQAVEREVASGKSSLLEADCLSLEQRYDEILKMAILREIPSSPKATGKRGRKKHHPAFNLWARLIDHKKEVLAFMRDFRVPFTNNQGERDIRMIKVKQKISGCFRSDEGAQYFCRIRGFLSTASKQGRDILDSLIDACNGKPFTPNV